MYLVYIGPCICCLDLMNVEHVYVVHKDRSSEMAPCTAKMYDCVFSSLFIYDRRYPHAHTSQSPTAGPHCQLD